MRRHISVLFLMMAFTISSFTSTHKQETKVSVMTFNIRYNTLKDAPNNWANRRDFASDIILDYSPDFVGTQEVLKDQLVDLQDRLPAYAHIGVGRDDGKDSGEFSALFYKKDKYKVLDSGTFWLSEHPEQIGVKGWDAVCNRVVSWGKFRSKADNDILFVFNTHFDHQGEVARKESAKLLLQKVQEIAGENPAIITGDFNATPDSNVYQILTGGLEGKVGLQDSYVLASKPDGPEWTFHGFGQTPTEQRHRIDYIFSNKQMKVRKYESISLQYGEIFPSDHLPVYAEIVF